MPVVVDTSAVLGVAMEDEAADFAIAVLEEIQQDGALAPSILWYELRNVLVVSERRGRISEQKSAAFLALLAELPIELTEPPSEGGVLELARRQGLSVYDASYLELAVRSGAPLATLDTGLERAALRAGAEVFPGPR